MRRVSKETWPIGVLRKTSPSRDTLKIFILFMVFNSVTAAVWTLCALWPRNVRNARRLSYGMQRSRTSPLEARAATPMSLQLPKCNDYDDSWQMHPRNESGFSRTIHSATPHPFTSCCHDGFSDNLVLFSVFWTLFRFSFCKRMATFGFPQRRSDVESRHSVHRMPSQTVLCVGSNVPVF